MKFRKLKIYLIPRKYDSLTNHHFLTKVSTLARHEHREHAVDHVSRPADRAERCGLEWRSLRQRHLLLGLVRLLAQLLARPAASQSYHQHSKTKGYRCRRRSSIEWRRDAPLYAAMRGCARPETRDTGEPRERGRHRGRLRLAQVAGSSRARVESECDVAQRMRAAARRSRERTPRGRRECARTRQRESVRCLQRGAGMHSLHCSVYLSKLREIVYNI